jgi:polyhydroxyalkanoate synthesis repressor PhaR
MQHAPARYLRGVLPVTVKKYGNRRLYDTADSRYVTLEELATKVRAGTDVVVVDAKTGADLTQATLTQIIVEGRGAAKLLPVPLLFQLIRMGDDSLAEFLGRWMSWALAAYQQARSGARTVAQYNPLAMAPFTAANALARLLNGPAAWGDPEPPPPPVAPEPATAQGSDVAELRRELEEIKRSLLKRKR